MADIIDFGQAKQARVAQLKPKEVNEPRFFCLSCDTDKFKLHATGAIHCANCGARIHNLTFVDTQAAP